MTTKENQLGMNPSTASHRLVKDILYSLILQTNQNTCFHCGEPMCRDTFSIEHKVPWLHSENPLELYFSLDNISFSHYLCNVKAGRKPPKKYFTEAERNASKRPYDKLRVYNPEKRAAQYQRTGQ